MPFPTLRTTGIHAIAGLHCILVEIHASGLTGIGYAWSMSRHQAGSIRSMVLDLAEALTGADATEVQSHWVRLWDRLNFIGQSGPPIMALSAVDTALWDLKARSAGMPLHRLLGGNGDPVPAYASGGFLSQTTDELQREAVAAKEAGFGAFKMKVGHSDWQVDVDRVRSVRDAVGQRMGIMVDANQCWRPEEAIRAGLAFQELNVVWLEEPVSVHDLEGSARVARRLDMPVAVGETIFTRSGLEPLMRAGAGDVITLQLMRCGGPTEFMRAADVALRNHLGVSTIAFTEICAHLANACGGPVLLEYLPGWWDRLFEEPLRLADGHVHLTDRPGLGLRFALDTVGSLAVSV